MWHDKILTATVIFLVLGCYLAQVTYNQVQPFQISHPASQSVHIITPYDCIPYSAKL